MENDSGSVLLYFSQISPGSKQDKVRTDVILG